MNVVEFVNKPPLYVYETEWFYSHTFDFWTQSNIKKSRRRKNELKLHKRNQIVSIKIRAHPDFKIYFGF